jgi:hypothetical protein
LHPVSTYLAPDICFSAEYLGISDLHRYINKPNNHTPSGKLIPITAPAAPWELVTMDFVVKLPKRTPKSGLWAQLTGKPNLPAYDSFRTLTDKLTKYVIIIPGCENWDDKQWANTHFDTVFPIFGVPASIISD